MTAHCAMSASSVRHEAMRIAGRKVTSDQTIEVLNPFTNAVVGTVPGATAARDGW